MLVLKVIHMVFSYICILRKNPGKSLKIGVLSLVFQFLQPLKKSMHQVGQCHADTGARAQLAQPRAEDCRKEQK